MLIEALLEEHEEISRFCERLERRCIALMEENEFDVYAFRTDIAFIRSYADARHHKKEEVLLFQAMLDELGAVAVPSVKNGMLVEHNMGRLYVMQLERAVENYATTCTPENKLDILTQAMGYVHLIRTHIDKENHALYPFAKRSLSPETLQRLDAQYASDWAPNEQK
ncbi:MAG: hemerythrin domain-containing protein [Butyricicoccus pullicaecorum]|nr:hemerythrin domain-containing protein [Butyricicoccus pullicaecorum]